MSIKVRKHLHNERCKVGWAKSVVRISRALGPQGLNSTETREVVFSTCSKKSYHCLFTVSNLHLHVGNTFEIGYQIRRFVQHG